MDAVEQPGFSLIRNEDTSQGCYEMFIKSSEPKKHWDVRCEQC